MRRAIIILTVSASLFVRCSNGKLSVDTISQQERLYNETSDSLRTYLESPHIKAILGVDTTIADYTTLTYQSFKDKYALTTGEMDLMAESFTVTYQIARSFVSLEKNMQQLEVPVFDQFEVMDTTAEYSFNKVMPIDTSDTSSLFSTGDSTILRLMEAFELEKDSLKPKSE